ncbi:hypothetical protein C922_05136 [Plasmodium inui San Antonio 1]|uniref:Uncharacterized protein n=1 Tax=Plasmodium inui San Antonio 1 TaxID=1237626 RepID=W6ZYP3_9APIC|nr:hypothetical protein C922_05136 [Plasmodium inui San Antonio 1]EUD64473.1 hypothetical protein C922_05136 [Plasmodium inui San Antonio 1]
MPDETPETSKLVDSRGLSQSWRMTKKEAFRRTASRKIGAKRRVRDDRQGRQGEPEGRAVKARRRSRKERDF